MPDASLPRQFAELESIWNRVNGCRMHARVARRSGRESLPVVLVHGLGVSSRYLVPTAVRLGETYQVYAPDLPGFGRSESPKRSLSIEQLADSLVAWMDAVGLDRAALIGNSLGCQIIVDLAVRYPQRAARAVLLAPTIDPHARTAPRQILRLLRDIPRESPSVILLVAMDYLTCGPVRLWQTFRHALRDPIEGKLSRVRCPTLVVRGTRDPIVPQQWAEEAARLLPDGRLVNIPGGPHAANYTMPLEFVNIVRPFLDEENH